MSRTRCYHCRKASRDGTAAVYCHTYYESGLHVGTRLYLCAGCFKDALSPLILRSAMDDALEDRNDCVLCGVATHDDPHYYYFTYYVPGMERADAEALLCAKCHALSVEWITSEGIRLPEREPTPARAQDTPSAWNLLAG
jgi:hypothetical protein